MNIPVLLFVHRLCVEAIFLERRVLPLSLQTIFVRDTDANQMSGNEQAFAPKISLNHETYHSNACVLDSVSLSLHGSGSAICHTSSLGNTGKVNEQDSENNEYEKGNTKPFIFVFSNSTISIFRISFDCGWPGTSVGSLSSSRLTISNCPIISNPESSPFVINNRYDDVGSTIFFVDCSHRSIEKSSLFPLVSFTSSHITHPRHTDNSQQASSTVVSCSGLLLSDTHLVFGSGPLVAFSLETARNTTFSNALETQLIGGRLVNITSGELKGSGNGALEGWSGSQKILDSCVTLSTNHLYGTTCIDMNLGGSLLCSNTSFSHCQTDIEPEYVENKTYTLQHRTGNVSLHFFNFQTGSIKFCRCSFFSMKSDSSGAALSFENSTGHVTVTESSFSTCTTDRFGTICFMRDPTGNAPLTVSSSLFLNCKANRGAGLDIIKTSTCTIADVVFQNNTARYDAGGLNLYNATSFSLSNCVFQKCSGGGNSWGGGAYLSGVTSLAIDSVLFRECTAQQGNDVYTYIIGTVQELAPRITNCDSTSALPTVICYNGSRSENGSTLIPTVPVTSTADLVEIENTTNADQPSSTIRMRVSTSVNGKMLVLVDNTNKHEPPNTNCSPPHANSPPTIARLLTFDFSSSTESASQTVSFGEWEELQYESEYRVTGASIANTRLSFSSITLTTPNPARIVQIVCSLGSGTDHCWLQLKGRTLPIGTYNVKLVAVPELTFSVAFDGSEGGQSTKNMFSSRHSEQLFGTGSKLSFSTNYEVESITFEDNSVLILLDPPRLVFATPTEQPRLTLVGSASFKDNSTKDMLLIPLSGVDLSGTSCTIKLLSSSSEPVSLTVPFHSDSQSIEVVVYSKDSSAIELKYGMNYTVEEITIGTQQYLVGKSLSVQVPDEPKRIEEGRVTLNGAKTEATIRLKGRVLTDGIYTLTLDSVSQELTSAATLSDSGELLFKVSISTSPTSILAFGETYTISSLKILEENVVVNSDVELAVPLPPIGTATSCDLDSASNSKFTLSLYGSHLPTTGSFIVSFDGLTQTIAVTMGSTGGSSSLVEVSTDTNITFGQTYTISAIVQGVNGGEDEHILCSGLTMTTPDGPSLLSVDSITLKEDDLNRVVLGVLFENMAEGSFVMKVKRRGSSTECTLSSPIIVTVRASTGTMTELVHESGKLEYGASYTIVSFESTTLPILIKDTTGFTVPPAPTRISACSSDLGGVDKKSAILRMGGVNLPVGKEITVTMKELSREELFGSPIIVSWRWEGSGTVSSGDVSVLVYGADPVRLRYGTSYCLVSLVIADTPSILDPNVTFTVPDEPARVENATPTLTSLRTTVIVKLSGRDLESGSYSITLSSHPSNPFSTTSTNGVIDFEVSTMASDTIHLAFGDNVTIVKVMRGLDEVFVNSDVSFTVPDAPIVKSAQVHPNSISTTLTLVLTGTDLKLDGFYTVTLTPPFSFDVLFNSSTTASSPELLLGRTDSLQHNTTYTIQSITRVGNALDMILTEGTVSFTTPKSRVPLILHVNEKEGEDDGFCGESDDPCATIDLAWSIVSALKAKTSTFVIVNSSRHTQPIVVSTGMSLDISNGGSGEPAMTVPLSASMDNKAGMVVVSDATFSIVDVTIKIESTDPSFVFLSASKSTVILKEGSFVGEPLSALSSNSESENVCSWDNGIIRLDNCVTTLNRMTFSSLSPGAIHMTAGNVNLEGVIFHNNSPNIASFPSTRRNIRCVEEGNMTIGSLSGGDGYGDRLSAWISSTDCTLSGEDAKPDSPLFVPTLSSESTSSWNKKEKRFSLTIKGTTMIPCGLSLKVFEMKKDKSEGESEKIELSLNTSDSFNETHINLSVPLTTLSSLDKSLEWRARLIFGLNQTTSEWFVVQKNSADQLAESSLDNMKWWLPLIIVLLSCALVVVIVFVVILRRRQKQKAQKASEAQQDSVIEMDEEKIDVEHLDHKRGVNTIRTSAGVLKGGSLDPEKGDESKTMETKLMNAPLAGCVSVLDCSLLETKEMLKMETLFDRLHRNKKGLIEKRRKQVDLARGLQKLGKLNSRAEVLCCLSSHWILLDVDGRMNIQMNRGSIPSLGQPSHVNHSAAIGSVVPEDSRLMNVNNENSNRVNGPSTLSREKEDQEGQRWQAPEQGGNYALPSCDVEKVTVFRLGLV